MLGQVAKYKVPRRAGHKNPHHTQDRYREMVTNIETVSAAGHVLPPYIIYNGRSHLMRWYVGIKEMKMHKLNSLTLQKYGRRMC